jgi:hypothetical protein
MSEMTMGEMLEKLFELREQKSELERQKTEVNKEIEYLEFKLIEAMDENGLDKLSVESGTASKKLALYPSVSDKDAFLDWAIKSDNKHMITAQVNRAAFKAYFEEHNEYPEGTDAYEKPKLSFRRSR